MNKALTALIIVSLLILFLIGCKTTEEPAPTDQQGTTQESTTEDTITGDLSEVDDLDTDISDEELEDIDASLDELNW